MKLIDRAVISRGFFLGWPIALQSILTNLLSMVDIAMVSHLGDSAVGAVGLGNRFLFMITVVILGVAWTVGVLSAQFYGAGQINKIRNTMLLAIILAHIVLAPLFVSNIFFADQFIALGSSDTEVIAQGKNYLLYAIPSLSFVVFLLVYDNAFRALNQTKLPLLLATIAIALNIFLNYWFIHGGLGIPALGVKGAAIATTTARLLLLLFVLFYLHKCRHILSFIRSDFSRIYIREDVLRFVKQAIPMMLGFGLWSSGVFVYQIIYGRLGIQELAVMSAVAPIEAVFLSLFFGLSSACSIMVGQSLGANRFEEAWSCFKSFTAFSPVLAFLLALVVFSTKDWVLTLFSGLSTETLETASYVLTLMILSSWLKVINMTISFGVLRAGGDNTFCSVINIVSMWLISIPATMVAAFYFKWPLIIVVLVTYTEEIVKAVLVLWRANKKVWIRNLTAS